MNKLIAKIVVYLSRKEWFPARKWGRWARLYNKAVREVE